MSQPPYWITGKAIDDLTEDDLATFEARRAEFMVIFAFQEDQMFPEGGNRVANLMQRSWDTGVSWYFMAIQSNGIYNLFHQHTRNLYGNSDDTWKYWRRNATEILLQKLEDKKQYLQRLEQKAIAIWESSK